jgi:hypothetical protein
MSWQERCEAYVAKSSGDMALEVKEISDVTSTGFASNLVAALACPLESRMAVPLPAEGDRSIPSGPRTDRSIRCSGSGIQREVCGSRNARRGRRKKSRD